MERSTYKAALAAVQNLCEQKESVDAADIAKAAKITSAEAEACILRMEEDDFAVVIEIDLCCGEEYIVKGLTEKGAAFLQEKS